MWYKRLGFHDNPFSIKPAAFNNEMVAYDLDYIYKKIENAEMLFIEGDYGTGKTTILKNIIARFRGKNRIIYFSFNSGKQFNMKELLDGASSFFGKIAGIKAKKVILLLDEVHYMGRSDSSQILKYYTSGQLQSVVFVNHDSSIARLPEEIEKHLGGNMLRTISLTQKDAFELVRNRIGNIDLFPAKILARIYALSDKNPRRFLEYCEDAARYAVETEDLKVTDFHVETALSAAIKEQKEKRKKQRQLNRIPKQEKAEEKPKFIETPAVIEKQEEPAVQIEKKRPEPEEKEVKEIQQQVPEEKPKELSPDQLKTEEDKSRQKKYKVNRLVDAKKDALGKVEASEDIEEEIPEYKVFVFDD